MNSYDRSSFCFELLTAQDIDPTKYCDLDSEVPEECAPPAPLVDFENYHIVVDLNPNADCISGLCYHYGHRCFETTSIRRITAPPPPLPIKAEH
jgi:hypothetical protein